MLLQGYKRSDIDHCLYTKKVKDGSLLILILYVNDMLLVGSSMDEMATLQSKLNDAFDMKYLGHANHILGMRIMRDRQKRLLYLSQSEYVDKVLRRFNMEEGKIVSVPLASYLKLCQNDCPKLDVEKVEMTKVPYLSAGLVALCML